MGFQDITKLLESDKQNISYRCLKLKLPNRIFDQVKNSSPLTLISLFCFLLTYCMCAGLVDSDWGGTPVEAWSSPEALAKCKQPVVPSKRKQRYIFIYDLAYLEPRLHQAFKLE